MIQRKLQRYSCRSIFIRVLLIEKGLKYYLKINLKIIRFYIYYLKRNILSKKKKKSGQI